jgi:transposase-like protein
MSKCKRCSGDRTVKNGIVRGQSRYRCKDCGYNFISGDRRIKESVAVKKALAVILYSLAKASFSMMGKIFGCSRSLVYRWIVKEGAKTEDPFISGEIKEIEFDEMWHFVQSKKTKNGSSKLWIVATGELLPGLSAIVMLQRSNDSTIKSVI